ncbi:MAG: GNAT family N-acetyltransferase [Acholeplasmatales bacterium]|jgi:predicted GNAT family N-acyltransferase|nr:GNAT family N-acetyltransferase [Acholeplasmatales bacterium]
MLNFRNLTYLTKKGHNLRMQIFCKEQGISPEIEIDQWDEKLSGSHHYYLYADGALIAYARSYFQDGLIHLGRFCVAQPFRKNLIGSQFYNLIEAKLLKQKSGKIVLNAQVRVQHFYASLGFVAEGEGFLEAGIPHQRMSKSLVNS